MSQDVSTRSRHPSYTAAASRSRLLGRLLLLALLIALAAILATTSTSMAEESTGATANRTAQGLLDRLDGKLSGATAGEPLLVRSLDGLQPAYYLVPAQIDGRTAGLVGVSPDGRKWQWYTDGYRQARFPVVSKGQALGLLGSEGATLVEAPDRALYWSGGTKLVSVDNPRQVRTREQVQAAAEPETLPDKTIQRESSDAAAGNDAQATASTLPDKKMLTVPHFYQPNNYYCGPASMKMMFAFYKPVIESQYDIGAVGNTYGSGTYKDDLLRTARFSYISPAYQDPALMGYRERSLGYGAMGNYWSENGTSDPDYPTRYADLKALVASGYPVLMSTWFNERHTAGHFRVLIGYDDTTDEFIVNDPWYSAPYYGPNLHFRQGFLVDDLWTRWSRWAIVMSPWKVRITAPQTVAGGAPFQVTATVRYLGPHPMEGRAAVVESQAAISLPDGFIADATVKMLPGITMSGTQGTVSWTVTPPAGYSGAPQIKVTAKGKLHGSSHSYPSYTDWIGGAGALNATDVTPPVNQPPAGAAVSPPSTTSAPDEYRTLTATYTDPNGVSDIRTAMLLVNSAATGANGLYASYSTATNNLYLRKADNSDWLPGVPLGSANVLDNGLVRLDAARTTVTRSGSNLIVSWAVSRGAAAGGPRNVYLQAMDQAYVTSDWKQLGTWLVNSPPVTGAVSGVGTIVPPERPLRLSAAYSDADGVADLQSVQLLINKGLAGAGAVWVRYDPASNGLYMRSGDNTTWLGPIAQGSATSLDNGRAMLSGSGTTLSRSGNVLTVNWGLQFDAAFSGQRYSLYSVAADRATSLANLPWVNKGYYTVSAAPAAVSITPKDASSLAAGWITLTSTYSDADGTTNLSAVELLVNDRAAPAGGVRLSYDVVNDKLWIQMSGLTGWKGGVAPGTPGTFGTIYGGLDTGKTTVVKQGDTLTVQWAVRFSARMKSRDLKLYMSALDLAGAKVTNLAMGSWSVK